MIAERASLASRQAIFDRITREAMHISGAEFLRRWDAGEYAGREPDGVPVLVAKALPLVRNTVNE